MTETLAIDARRRQIEELLMRIEGAFLDTPGLRLTVAETSSRCAADAITCEAILDALVDASVLFKSGDCVYGRLLPHVIAA